MEPLLGLSAEQVRAGLGAMRAVAAADGKYDDFERELISVMAKTLGGPADAEETSSDALAKVFPDELWRKRMLQALIVTALIDGEASRKELECIERYQTAFGLADPWVKNLSRLINEQYLRLRLDFMRRMPIPRKVVDDTLAEEGSIKGLWKVYRTISLKGTNEPALAWKYKQLGLLPQGTLGHEFWKHMTERQFAFPGEPAGLMEKQCHHDLTHVLTGYGTDPAGECEIAAFYAGYQKEEPFGFLFMVLLMFHVGYNLVPTAVTASRLQLDPAKAVAAMQRGSRINRDLTDHWDFWPELDKPLADVRKKYNIT